MFDCDKISLGRNSKNYIKTRMMLPISVQCNKCCNYTFKGTKVNARKYNVMTEKFVGEVLRFSFNCNHCSTELMIKSNLNHSDYRVDSGASKIIESNDLKNKSEDFGWPEKHMEKLIADRKRKAAEEKRIEEEEDEALVKSIFSIRRVSDEDIESETPNQNAKRQTFPGKASRHPNHCPLVKFVIKKRRSNDAAAEAKQKVDNSTNDAAALLSLGMYGTDDD